ncbi:hypothetical protein FACS189494_10070 [Spirochaetia bacterium]|nr:hypothetical protein FACS189494_10070 [Spirochaetia bacterium]
MPVVNDVPNQNYFNPGLWTNLKPKEKTKKTEKRKVKDFENLLLSKNESVDAPVSDGVADAKTIDSLLDDVHAAGDALAKRPFPDEIKKYRETIKRFIGVIVENSYIIEEGRGVPNWQKPKYNIPGIVIDKGKRTERSTFLNLKIIDTKLDNLAAEILVSQKSRIKILAAINEINGLLVDMLH